VIQSALVFKPVAEVFPVNMKPSRANTATKAFHYKQLNNNALYHDLVAGICISAIAYVQNRNGAELLGLQFAQERNLIYQSIWRL
jgi:hypothetical protein